MGLPVEVNNLMLGSLGGYTIGRSLRFRSSASAYLQRTMTTATNQYIWTWSAWVKRGIIGTSQTLFEAWAANNDTQYGAISFYSDQLAFGGWTTGWRKSTQVFRDPSAWYHIVVAVDTTQATGANRVKLYVNGVQITSFAISNDPTQNTTVGINTAVYHRLGQEQTAQYFDGYLAEVNFIDGQALTPTSFGAYDTNGVWQPKKYTGTYGTNGFYLPFSLNTTATYEGVFNGSSQSIGIPANSVFSFGSGNFTAECWVNAKSFSNFPALIDFWSNSSPSYITGQWQFAINTAGLLTMSIATSGSALTTIQQSSGSVILNTWNHVAVVRNGTTVTLYLNGVSVGSSTFTGTVGHSTGAGGLAKQSNSAVAYLNGSLSNVRITNNAVYTAGFTPSTSPLTAISGTQLLTLQNSTLIDNSANAISLTNNGSVTFPVSYPFSTGTAISNDQSGNGNNWTPNNISLTAGTTYDSMIDSPTPYADGGNGRGNYAVLNPLDNFSSFPFTSADGNLKASSSTNNARCGRATFGVSSGKWYWEVVIDSAIYNTYYPSPGILPTSVAIPSQLGSSGSVATTGIAYMADGEKYSNGTLAAYGSSFTQNDVIGFALDMDAGTLVCYKNNVSQGTLVSGLSGSYSPSWNVYSSALNFNFGQRPFSYTPPSGFKALNTYNLPAPSIANGAQYFAATLYTGNGGTQTISNAVNGVSFQPDFVWMKSRNNTYGHNLYDSVRGGTKRLVSNLTDAEFTVSGGVNSFNADGMTIQNDATNSNINASATTYVGWQWKGGGTAVTNNNGTISSQVSANTSAGFSIVTYTGTGANATVGHGLGVAPSMVIFKRRDNTGNWAVYHASVGNTAALYMNLTAAQSVNSVFFNNTSPTSSVVSIGTGTDLNVSGSTNVAYCFSAVRGFSAFGSYTGNGSTDGPFIYTGFRPRFILTKCSSNSTASTVWTIWDTSRNTYNASVNQLYPNSSDAESVDSSGIDILSNGFKPKRNSEYANFSGWTYVYAAFAENPFNISRAR